MGKRDGLGIFRWPNGRKYIGEWKNGVKDGLCSDLNERGESIIEEWHQGL